MSARNIEGSANAIGALAHPQQAKVPLRGGETVGQIEAAAVIADLQDQARTFGRKPNINLCGAGMPDRVVHGLLNNTQQVLFGITRECERSLLEFIMEGGENAVAPSVCGCGEGGDQI